MATEKPRLYWADYLRTFVVLLVLNVHACATYSHAGGWYLQIGEKPSALVRSLLVAWQLHIHSFFMGLLFFLAGYFAHLSLAKKGASPFVKERFMRLFVPAFVYMALFHPLVVWMNAGDKAAPGFIGFYSFYLRKTAYLANTGHLWFALFLLILSVWLACHRRFVRPLPENADAPLEAVSFKPILAFGASLVATTALVRIWFPMRYGFHDFQPCYFPQYILSFAAGVYIARRKGLTVLASSEVARRAGFIALFAAPIALGVLFALGKRNEELYFGGTHWQAFGFAAWEQFTGLGFSLGLISLFSRKLNVNDKRLQWMSARSFGVYVLHGVALVAISSALRPIQASPFLLAGVVTVLGIVLSHIAAEIVSRTPGLSKLF